MYETDLIRENETARCKSRSVPYRGTGHRSARGEILRQSKESMKGSLLERRGVWGYYGGSARRNAIHGEKGKDESGARATGN